MLVCYIISYKSLGLQSCFFIFFYSSDWITSINLFQVHWFFLLLLKCAVKSFQWIFHFISVSVQFSHSVVSNSLQLHEPQHARPPRSSPTPAVHPNSCPSSRWCHLILSHPLLLLPSIFPSIKVFSNESALCIRWPKYWSLSFNISTINEQPYWSPLGLSGWISSQSKGLSRVFSNTTVQKHQFFGAQLSSQFNSHIHTWPLEKP